MTTTESRSTDQLRTGDVILEYGMRLVLDQPIETYVDRGTTVYHTSARIENIDAVRQEARGGNPTAMFVVSQSVAHTERWDGGWHRDDPYTSSDPRWTVQGNHLATWPVVVESRDACHIEA